MKHQHLFLLAALATCAAVQAQSLKLDFDMTGRSTNEVTEPGYTSWAIASKQASASRDFEVVNADGTTSVLTVTVAATNPDDGLLKTSWSKTHIQSPYYARLVNDGITIAKDGEAVEEFALNRGGIELRIKGFRVGTGSVQTFNNSWENGSSYEMVPMDIFFNGVKKVAAQVPTVRIPNNADASRSYFEFDVTDPGQEVVFRFMPTEGYTLQDASKKLYNRVFLDGLEIGLPNADQQASHPMPADFDMHADFDTAPCLLTWRAASPSVSRHDVYLGTDSLQVVSSTTPLASVTDTVVSLTDLGVQLSVHEAYYWRVDEVQDGKVTPGAVWSFRPRRLAFRTAEGYGRHAIGGRGGQVVHVTNLNDDGPGSFREAMTNDIGPRTIVFDVSGIIRLESRLVGVGKYITVAGQTAPGKGVCFRAAPMGVGSDAIWRHVRMRLGAGETYDGIGMAGSDHSILDHASISWTIDESFSSRGAKNITLQHTLISEALNVAGHKNYDPGTAHGYAGSVSGDVGSLHHNLLAHNYGRNWSLAGGLDGSGAYAGRLDVFNMVVYNWGGRTTDGGAHEVNFVGNYYKIGPATSQSYLLNAQLEGTGSGSQSYYYHNNIKANQNGSLVWDGKDDTKGRKYTLSGGQQLDWDVFVKQPFFPSYARVESASDAYKSVMSDAGCTMPVLDDHDQRIIREVMEGTYTFSGSYKGSKGIIDNEADCGGYEDYPEVHREATFDSDQDGLPDWWEQLYGTNVHSAAGDFSDANLDADADGYTMLEDYLEYMARPHYLLAHAEAASVADDYAAMFRGYKAPLSYRVEVENPGDKCMELRTVICTDAEGSEGRAYIAIAWTDPNGIEQLHGGAASDVSLTSYDLMGRRLAGQHSATGLRFQSGRKTFVR